MCVIELSVCCVCVCVCVCACVCVRVLELCVCAQAQLLLQPPPVAPATLVIPILNDTDIEDLLQIEGIELMEKPSGLRSATPVVPENDALVREALMMATECRRLREENEVCQRACKLSLLIVVTHQRILPVCCGSPVVWHTV